MSNGPTGIPRRIGRLVVFLGVAALIGASACSSSPGSGASAKRTETNGNPAVSPDSAHPTPVFDGSNGKQSSAEVTRGEFVESLSDMKRVADFIGIAKVESQELIEVDPPESEMWSTIRSAKIGRVLWHASKQRSVPESVRFVGTGWMRNNDTEEVWPLIPELGPRLDVGDTFLAMFAYDTEKQVKLESGESTTLDWVTGGPTAVLVRDRKIVSSNTTASFMKKFDGRTVEEFAAALESASPE